VPSSGCGDGGVGIGFPSEGLGLGVVLDEVAVDGGLKIYDSEKGPAPEAPFGWDRKEAFDSV